MEQRGLLARGSPLPWHTQGAVPAVRAVCVQWGLRAALGFVLVSDVCWAAGASSAGVLLSPVWGRLELGGGCRHLSPYIPFAVAETCTNLMAFFIPNRAAFLSTITRVLTHLRQLAHFRRASTCLLGGQMPLSPPSPNTSVLAAV